MIEIEILRAIDKLSKGSKIPSCAAIAEELGQELQVVSDNISLLYKRGLVEEPTFLFGGNCLVSLSARGRMTLRLPDKLKESIGFRAPEE